MTALEKDIEKGLGRMIGRLGGKCMKWVCPGWSGVPDRICLLPRGRIIFVELKRPEGGVVSQRQWYWMDTLTNLGFECWIVHNTTDIKSLEMHITGAEE